MKPIAMNANANATPRADREVYLAVRTPKGDVTVEFPAALTGTERKQMWQLVIEMCRTTHHPVQDWQEPSCDPSS